MAHKTSQVADNTPKMAKTIPKVARETSQVAHKISKTPDEALKSKGSSPLGPQRVAPRNLWLSHHGPVNQKHCNALPVKCRIPITKQW